MPNNNASPSKYQSKLFSCHPNLIDLNGDMHDEYNYDEILEDAEGHY